MYLAPESEPRSPPPRAPALRGSTRFPQPCPANPDRQPKSQANGKVGESGARAGLPLVPEKVNTHQEREHTSPEPVHS
eukprot:624850-Rhodomonas_salina.1